MESAIPHEDSSNPGSRSASSFVARYGLAIAAFAAALVLTLFIRYASGNPTFFSFYIAIFVSIWFGGRGPGAGPADAASDPSGGASSLTDAVQALGLKLEARKAPIDQLIVDHVEKLPKD